jgi:hypothetical protein
MAAPIRPPDVYEGGRILVRPPSSDTNGNPKVKAFLEDLIDDYNICRNPLLAGDVLLRQCDQSFSNGATGYSPESSSIKWDHLKS